MIVNGQEKTSYIVTVQHIENYGVDAQRNQWKFKGGSSYLVKDCYTPANAVAQIQHMVGEWGQQNYRLDYVKHVEPADMSTYMLVERINETSELEQKVFISGTKGFFMPEATSYVIPVRNVLNFVLEEKYIVVGEHGKVYVKTHTRSLDGTERVETDEVCDCGKDTCPLAENIVEGRASQLSDEETEMRIQYIRFTRTKYIHDFTDALDIPLNKEGKITTKERAVTWSSK